ncbi:hypothetical protein KC19_2G136800 [Ceratodon purpureus]|uniref:Uncharacterized protein n=1 Tax=Ceratodon purpureus TaxID=3225 RepID=A0A8T0IW38_CERPU|nr:hypothetical protein KC19_2G136800 [Ceratodon purpureus]
MECRKVEEQALDEYEVHVAFEGRSSFHQNLRFALLASSWLPGILVWSVLHLLLVFVATLFFILVVIYMLIMDIATQLVLVPMVYIFIALCDIVVLIVDTLRYIFVTIRVIVSCEATPGEATKFAYEHIGGIRLFRYVRFVVFENEGNGRIRWLMPFLLSVEIIKDCCSGPSERGEAREPGLGPGEPRPPREEPFRLQLKRWCEEIVPCYDVLLSD